MPKIAIITDSTANLSAEFVNQNGIKVVPLKIHWGEETLLDGVDITPEAFYQRLKGAPKLPTTSQPSIHDFLQVYNEVAKDCDAILVVLISSGISGTFASASAAANEFSSKPVRVVDSRSTSAGLSLIVQAVVDVSKNVTGLDELAAFAENIAKKTFIFFMVDTLEYLHKGGRIGGAARFFGAALNIKPILYLNEEGKIDTLEKVRTKQQALNRLLELVKERSNGAKTNTRIIHAAAQTEAEEFNSRVIEQINCLTTDIIDLSPVIGAHVGPGTIGLAFYSE